MRRISKDEILALLLVVLVETGVGGGLSVAIEENRGALAVVRRLRARLDGVIGSSSSSSSLSEWVMWGRLEVRGGVAGVAVGTILVTSGVLSELA